jgi:hypothetical protein
MTGKSYPTRGFGSMDRLKQRAIASKGGKAAHEKGRAHEWTSEEASVAGKKGGARRKHRDVRPTQEPDATPRRPDGADD